TDPDVTKQASGVFSYFQLGQADTQTTVPVNVKGRYVRVQLAGTNRILSLAEVQVFSLTDNSSADAGAGDDAADGMASGDADDEANTSSEAAAPVNIALGKSAMESSTDWGGVASRAVDGNTSGSFGDNSVTHTTDSPGTTNP